MNFKADVEYTLEDYRVCAKGARLCLGAKFYIKRVKSILLLAIGCAMLCIGVEQMGFMSPENDLLVWIIIYVVVLAFDIIVCTDGWRAKRLMRRSKKEKHIKSVIINDDGVKMIYDYGESLINFSSITNLYFSRGVWLIILAFDAKHKKQFVITLAERCFTEGNPAQFGAYLSRMCGKEVKSF